MKNILLKNKNRLKSNSNLPKSDVVTSISLILLFFCILTSLYFAQLLKLTKNEELSGVINTTKRDNLSWDKYWTGEYQKNFSEWFMQSFPHRNNIIRSYSQFKYSVFGKSPNSSVVIGKDNTLYGSGDIDEYLQLRPIASDEYLNILIDDIKYINNFCDLNDIIFFLLITPSKADIYPERIPDKYYFMAPVNKKDSAYLRFIALLENNDIGYFDSAKYLKENRDKIKYPLFATTGVHWNYIASAYAASGFFESMYERTGIRLKKMVVTGVDEVESPVAPDTDLLDLMNLYKGTMDTKYYYPRISFTESPNTVKPNLFIRGGSFNNEILDIIGDKDVFSNIDFMFYNVAVRSFPSGYYEIDNEFKNVNFGELLKNKDMIIIEVNQEAIGSMRTGFMEYFVKWIENGGFSQ
ncbi:hypothetical protein OXPF_31350 [Oxobacter pfennigii]|uniref:AlgX/AlgJ SGNH hydrolase-like domain-containing protein n=1 Tax=Oxobacter pfennigii TaxID=36849 RepID=A0A0P8W7D7_9CLOT|nr:hypothetical protein [Oxobacter pfennigii]KPU43693.1 hypothetical protein OXPF_31350 [Oxobacter pfennigii]